MPIYTYKARATDGALNVGEIEAASELQLQNIFRERKLIPMEVKQKTAFNSDISQLSIFKPRVQKQDLAIFCRQFSVVIEAGISIGAALDIMRKQIENPTLRETVGKIYEEVQKGRNLSECMREHKDFPPILINMIEAGEVSGTLDKVMNQMALKFEKEMKTQRKIKGAMTMPVITLVLMVVVVVGMLLFVIPNFVGMFKEAGAELPMPTKVVLAISDFLQEKWYIPAGIVVAVFGGLKALRSNPQGRKIFDQTVLNLPMIGVVQKKIITASFAGTLSTMMDAGIPILQSMEVVKKVVNNAVAIEFLDSAIAELKKGSSLAAQLQESTIFPPMLTSMVRIGEETGALDSILAKTAEFFEGEVEVAVEQLSQAINPLMTIVMGLVIGGMMMAIVLPMFSLASQAM